MPFLTITDSAIPEQIPGKATRKGIILQNRDTANSIYVNPSKADLEGDRDGGIEIIPGQSLPLLGLRGEAASPLYVTTAAGLTASLWYVEFL